MSDATSPADCPYVGLEPFEAAHADFFFGRRQDSKILADYVTGRPVTVLYGPSGVGKSSVLNVGLPAAMPARAHWMIARLREWQDPGKIERLAVAAVLAAWPGRLNRHVDQARFVPLAMHAIRSSNRPLLLILDQFEEYFLYRDRTLARPIERALADLIGRRDLALHVLIAMREDSLHRLDELRSVIPGILDTTVRLDHLSDAGVAEAIVQPVMRYNERYRSGQPPIIVPDTLAPTLTRQLREAETGLGKGRALHAGEKRIELPYLQLALTKLWKAEGGRDAAGLHTETLTGRLGGVSKIVRSHVRETMDSLTEPERALCVRILDRLVTGIGSKVAYPTEALAADVAGFGIGTAKVEEVLRKLARREARILKPVTTDRLPGYEIVHDVLGVPLLEWLQGQKVEAQKRAELAAAERRKQEELAAAERQKLEELAEAERQKLEERARSDAALIHAEAQLEISQQKLINAQQQRKTSFLRWGIAAAVVACVCLGTFAGYAWKLADDVRSEAVRAAGNYELYQREVGRGFWGSLIFTTDAMTPGEIGTLWNLAQSTSANKDGFVAPLLAAERAVVAKFSLRPLPVQRALGLAWPDAEMAERLVSALLTTGLELNEPDRLRAWASSLGAVTQELRPDRAKPMLQRILTAMATPPDQASPERVERLSQKDRNRAGATHAAQRSYGVAQLAQALAAMPVQLTDEQADVALRALIAALGINRIEDGNVYSALYALAKRLPQRMAVPSLPAALEKVTEAKSTSFQHHDELVAELAMRLAPQQAEALLAQRLEALATATRPDRFQVLTRNLEALSSNVSRPAGPALLQPMLARLAAGGSVEQFPFLAVAMGSLADIMSPEQRSAALSVVLSVAADPATPLDWMENLAQAAQKLRASPAQAQPDIGPVLDRLSRAETPNERDAVAYAVKTLAGGLTADQAQAAAELIVPVKQFPGAATMGWDVATSIEALADRLAPEAANSALRSVLDELRHNTGSMGPEVWTGPAQSLAARVAPAPDQARLAVEDLLQRLPAAGNSEIRQALARVLQAFARHDLADQAAPARLTLLTALRQSESADEVSTLAQTLQMITPGLTCDETAGVMVQINRMLADTRLDAETVTTLAQAILALSDQFLCGQGKETLAVAKMRLADAGDQNEAAAWAAVAGQLSQPQTGPAFIEAILDLLKYPTAAGLPTNALMGVLSKRYPDPRLAHGLPEALPWFVQQLGSDAVARPPQRPTHSPPPIAAPDLNEPRVSRGR